MLAFAQQTRNRTYALPAQSRITGGGNTVRWDISRVGLLARIWLDIRGVVSGLGGGTSGTYGNSAFIKRVTLSSNAGYNLFYMSGATYNWLLRPYLDFPADPHPQSTARNA